MPGHAIVKHASDGATVHQDGFDRGIAHGKGVHTVNGRVAIAVTLHPQHRPINRGPILPGTSRSEDLLADNRGIPVMRGPYGTGDRGLGRLTREWRRGDVKFSAIGEGQRGDDLAILTMAGGRTGCLDVAHWDLNGCVLGSRKSFVARSCVSTIFYPIHTGQ
jgi:hypothetical protein